MLQRLATRATFWGALTMLSMIGAVASVGVMSRAAGPVTDFGANVAATDAYIISVPTLANTSPLLSFAALILALGGWWLLQKDRARHDGTEHALREQVRRLESAIDASVDGLFLLKTIRSNDGEITDFEITDVNPTGTRLLRTERERLVGQRVRRDLPTEYSDKLLQQYIEAVTFQSPVTEDVRVDPRQFDAGWLSHHAVPTDDGVAVTIRDVSERKREELRLRRASLTDHLTLLYNRRGFLTLADQHLRIARRQEQDAVLLYVDMDDFKLLNDTFGHAEGDRALMAVARLLRRSVRDCDVVGRMGGDEFTIMALDAGGAAARLIQRRIEERVALLNASGELNAAVSLTIGHTRVRPTDNAGLDELLARADQLLYARKRRRKLTLAAASRSVPWQTGRNECEPIGKPLSTALRSNGVLLTPDRTAIARVATTAGAPPTGPAAGFSPTQAA